MGFGGDEYEEFAFVVIDLPTVIEPAWRGGFGFL